MTNPDWTTSFEAIQEMNRLLQPIADRYPDARWTRSHHLLRTLKPYGGISEAVIWLIKEGAISQGKVYDKENIEKLLRHFYLVYYGQYAYDSEKGYSKDVIGDAKYSQIELAANSEINFILDILFADDETEEIIFSVFPFKDETCNSCAIGKHCGKNLNKELIQRGPEYTNQDEQVLVTLTRILDPSDYKVELGREPTRSEINQDSILSDGRAPQVLAVRKNSIRNLILKIAFDYFSSSNIPTKKDIFIDTDFEPTSTFNSTMAYESQVFDLPDLPPIESDTLPMTYNFIVAAFRGKPKNIPLTNSVKIEYSDQFVTILIKPRDLQVALLKTNAITNVLPYGKIGQEDYLLVSVKPDQKIKIGTYALWVDQNMVFHHSII